MSNVIDFLPRWSRAMREEKEEDTPAVMECEECGFMGFMFVPDPAGLICISCGRCYEIEMWEEE